MIGDKGHLGHKTSVIGNEMENYSNDNIKTEFKQEFFDLLNKWNAIISIEKSNGGFNSTKNIIQIVITDPNTKNQTWWDTDQFIDISNVLK